MRRLALVKSRNLAALLATLSSAVLTGSAVAGEGQRVDLVNRTALRVCADPANMPFSNEKREGFENKIADIVAGELKLPIEYTWFPQATGFIRQTLFAKRCDVVMGYAQGDELVLNTNHYYRSTYALVLRKGAGLDGVDSLADPRLGDLTEDLETRLRCTAGRTVDRQVDPVEAETAPRPALARGAWFTEDGYTQMDHQRHPLSGLLATLPLLERS